MEFDLEMYWNVRRIKRVVEDPRAASVQWGFRKYRDSTWLLPFDNCDGSDTSLYNLFL
jgi:hypothetical protein